MARPITKWAISVQTPEELPGLLQKAFEIAVSGRPGPVLIDIPMDVQRAEVECVEFRRPPRPRLDMVDTDWITGMLQGVRSASRPLILAGGGIRSAQAAAEFREFAEKLGVPVIHSLMAVDVLPYGHPLRVGMIGSYGNRWANLAMSQSDCLLVLGSRLDVRQTGACTDAFREGRSIYHVDCEAGEMNNRITGCETLVAELSPFLQAGIRQLTGPRLQLGSWKSVIAKQQIEWPDTQELRDAAGINPNRFFHELSHTSEAAAAFVVDVGQHQMWAAQSVEVGEDQRFLTSGGMGAMGFALPASIGAAFASPGRAVVTIAGDGGFQLNLQELQTIFRDRLPIKMVILNNQCHGMVRQFQQSYFDERYQSTMWGYSAPSFARVAQAYGVAATTIAHESDIAAGLKSLWQAPDAPFLLEVMIDAFTNAYPKMAFGRSVGEMEPAFAPTEMEGT
jgi:acetolactate synthase-1/2/3 large subunit